MADPITHLLPARPLLPWWRERIFMADALPPPYTPLLADEAPPFLAGFIYYLVHDFMPAGAIEYALSRARERTDRVPPGPVRDFAELTARELAYKAPPEPEGATES